MMKFNGSSNCANAKVDAWLKAHCQDSSTNPNLKPKMRKRSSKKKHRALQQHQEASKNLEGAKQDLSNLFPDDLGFHSWSNTIFERSMSSDSSMTQQSSTSSGLELSGLMDAFGEFVDYFGTFQISKIFEDEEPLASSSPRHQYRGDWEETSDFSCSGSRFPSRSHRRSLLVDFI
ncbi:hypothetical protein GUITHDRAFT_108582 [Guillardia theta CCMP2712]|uniref:Uncharacterized protein n=1 Tax=Guillardia theta (strain CCMP2712) TaxID=905079 RepID=L1JC71_GUITC|nr:hypothetical protein GUITHDRAFT_108582 [Guillardia theta CCMP2712]EKX45709.1 hypothetical protein GUITHDRAFT_108582 [Guillardia theta CCMP2712]|eukprot:XP_005832689.1 hypothetical protein GUITHDRAFT_108582 [Guillardia theta CCMP2712]